MIRDLWYKNAVVHCLHVGSFMDTNGDGVGDFEGLMRRLDYLAGLGITCIWLMPFQTSPRRDDGYDISDYFAVDPCYGTLGDFVELTHAAKQRGIRAIIDLVVNHTSDKADADVEVELHLGEERGRKLVNLFTEAHSQADARGRHHIVLEGYGYRWYRVGGLDYILERTEA